MSTFISKIVAIFAMIPFSGPTWFIISIMGFIVWIFYKGDKDPSNRVSWEDLIVDSANNKASPYKLGFLIGMIVGTWLIIDLEDKGRVTYDILGLYLAYLLGGAGWGYFIKSSATDKNDITPTK